MDNEPEIDEQQEAFNNLVNDMNTLYEFFVNPQRDMSKLDKMLRLYDRHFERMIEYFLRGTLGNKRDYSSLLHTYKAVGEMIPAVLSTEQNGKEIGNLLVQEVLCGQKEVLGKRPSLLQYVFHKFSKAYNIPFQPLYFSYGVGAGKAMEEDDSVAIGEKIYSRHNDNASKNAWAIFALAHELQHIRQRHANPNGTKEERILHLYSQLQKLEDGYENGHPSQHIAQHEQFPDEIRADYDACPFAYRYIASELTLPEEVLQPIREFLKNQQVKLVSKNVQSEKPLYPEEYLDYFVDTKLLNNQNLSSTERERVDKLVQTYEEITQKNLQL